MKVEMKSLTDGVVYASLAFDHRINWQILDIFHFSNLTIKFYLLANSLNSFTFRANIVFPFLCLMFPLLSSLLSVSFFLPDHHPS